MELGGDTKAVLLLAAAMFLWALLLGVWKYWQMAEAEDALAGGEVDAYSGNDFVAVERPADFALSAELPPIRNGIGFRKDAEALGAGIRVALDAMIEDGIYLAILERYDVAHVALP